MVPEAPELSGSSALGELCVAFSPYAPSVGTSGFISTEASRLARRWSYSTLVALTDGGVSQLAISIQCYKFIACSL